MFHGDSLYSAVHSHDLSYPHTHTHAHSQHAHTHHTRTHTHHRKSAKAHAHGHTTNPAELFVGNLSYFCTERDLFALFEETGAVQEARVIMNDAGTRSLAFGFVTMSSVHEARQSERLLNGQFFMGRTLRVATAEKRHDTRGSANKEGVQMHVAFSSLFTSHETCVRPTETFLRKVFTRFGVIVDVAVKEYNAYMDQGMQEGYAFVSFDSEDAVLRAVQACTNIIVQGISLKCTPTHSLSNPHAHVVCHAFHPAHNISHAHAHALHEAHARPFDSSLPFSHSQAHAHSLSYTQQRELERDLVSDSDGSLSFPLSLSPAQAHVPQREWERDLFSLSSLSQNQALPQHSSLFNDAHFNVNTNANTVGAHNALSQSQSLSESASVASSISLSHSPSGEFSLANNNNTTINNPFSLW